jgi:hypothetical protein
MFSNSVAVAGTVFEEIVVGLDVFCQVYDLASLEFFSGFEDNRVAVEILTLIMTSQPRPVDELASGCFKSGRYFIFWEDRFIRAFRDASAAIDAGFRIDVHCGPFFNRFSCDNTVHRANLDATTISKA